MSRTVRSVPRTVPVTFERPRARRGRSRRPRRSPARRRGPQHHLERPAEAPVLEAEAEQRLAAGGAHRAEVAQRDAGAPPQLDREHAGWRARACSGHAPRARARARRARGRAAPASTGSATRGSSRGSSEPSQSMKQTTSPRAAHSPAKHAAPKPRRGSCTTCAPEPGGELAPSRRSSRCRRRSARSRAGMRASTHGQRRALVEHRKDHVGARAVEVRALRILRRGSSVAHDPRHRRRGLHRLARRRRAAGRRARRAGGRRAAARRPRGAPGLPRPAPRSWIEGDLREPAVAERRSPGSSAVCHQAAMVGLGADIGDIADYVGHNDLGTAVLLRALAGAGFGGRLVLASSMVVYGEGRYRCAEHGERAPGPAARRDARRGRLRAALPGVRRGARARQPVDEDAPLDPRSVYAATKVHQEHLCCGVRARDRGAGDGLALPQRLRAADAARHAVRRGGQHLPQRAGGRRGAAGVRGRRPAARLRPRPRRRPRQRPRAHRRPSRSPAPSTSPAARRSTVLEMAEALADAFEAGAQAGGHRRVARRRRASHRSRRPTVPRACSASARVRISPPGCASSHAPRSGARDGSARAASP